MTSGFEYIESLSCFGEFGNNQFDRMSESRREVWFGPTGAGAIRSQFIRSVFFTDEQRNRFRSLSSRTLRESTVPSLDLFAANCFYGPRRELERLPHDPSEVAERLRARRQLSLKGIHHLMGEALVPRELRRLLVGIARELPDVIVVGDAKDQLGRPGVGIARVEGVHRTELILDRDSDELLGYRHVLVDPEVDFAPVGALIGWCSFVARAQVESLPEDLPPFPEPPCASPGSGRGTTIRPGFTLGTGPFTDLQAALDRWLSAGVITDVDLQAFRDSQ